LGIGGGEGIHGSTVSSDSGKRLRKIWRTPLRGAQRVWNSTKEGHAHEGSGLEHENFLNGREVTLLVRCGSVSTKKEKGNILKRNIWVLGKKSQTEKSHIFKKRSQASAKMWEKRMQKPESWWGLGKLAMVT